MGLETVKGETTGAGETEKQEQFEIYERMLGGRNREDFEKHAKKMFIDQPANMQLLIVVDKLLTGFDAPSCTYLYIDKEMRDHGLFQAICRVNRTESDDKEFGYIVDYQNLFDSLNKSIADYTSDAFDQYDAEDVQGLLVDRLEKSKENLDYAIETVELLTRNVEPPKQIEEYIKFFIVNSTDRDVLKEYEEKRLTFYLAVVSLIRAFNNIAPEMEDAGYSKAEIEKIKQLVNEYSELREALKNASGDYIDLKSYEPDMRRLLDMYVTADASRILSKLDDNSLLEVISKSGINEATEKLPQSIKSNKNAVAETLEANMRKVIIQEMPINPIFYGKMSVLLQELIEQRKNQSLEYEKYLKKIESLAKQVNPENRKNLYPPAIDTVTKQSLYDLLKDETRTLALESDITASIEENWKGNIIKERKVRYAITEHIKDQETIEQIMEMLKNQDIQ